MAWPYLVLYMLVGLAASSFVEILGALPGPLITAIAGLALFSPLMGKGANGSSVTPGRRASLGSTPDFSKRMRVYGRAFGACVA
jgi:predicted benzoate:H+ symporter BenE